MDLEDWSGNKAYAKYGEFAVGNEVSLYRLTVGAYSGTAGDSLAYHNGKNFTTKDNNNSEKPGNNCAIVYTGAWWYRGCLHSNLNGQYVGNVLNLKGIVWNKFGHVGNHLSMKFSEMKLRVKT